VRRSLLSDASDILPESRTSCKAKCTFICIVQLARTARDGTECDPELWWQAMDQLALDYLYGVR
jgi:hypothetical protein